MKIEEFIGKSTTYEPDGQFILTHTKRGGEQLLLELRGWGAIQNLCKTKDGSVNLEQAANFQDALGHWIAEAINEKRNSKPKPTGPFLKYDIKTLLKVKEAFDFHSDSSTKCFGYKSLCKMLKAAEKDESEADARLQKQIIRVKATDEYKKLQNIIAIKEESMKAQIETTDEYRQEIETLRCRNKMLQREVNKLSSMNLYEVKYHRLHALYYPKIEKVLATDRDQALKKFWLGRNKENWDVDSVTIIPRQS